MSFNVTLYSGFSKPDNSTKRPSSGTDFPCNIVESCGVITPRISFAQGNDWNPSNYNYARVPAWNRYYWITEWTFDHGRWYASMQVDPLSSMKDEILSLDEYVSRASSRYDSNAVDNMYPTTVSATKLSQQKHIWQATGLSDGAYVIGVLGNNKTTVGGVAYYIASASNLNTLTEHMMTDTSWIGSVEEISDELLRCLVNPMQYITSIMWFPFRPWNSGSSSPVYAGWWNTGVGLTDCSDSAPFIGGSLGTITSHPQSSRGNYLNYSPYTEIFVEIPPFGKFSLDPFKYPPGSDLRYSIATDAISGMSTLHLYTSVIGDGDMLMCKVGVDLSVGQSTSSSLGAAGSAIAALPRTKAPSWMASPILKEGNQNAIGDALTALNPEMNVVGQNGGTAIYKQPACLTVIHHNIVNEDNNHLGRPLCQRVNLGSLSGYVQVLNFDTNLPCTITEKNMIKNYMEGGVFIE